MSAAVLNFKQTSKIGLSILFSLFWTNAFVLLQNPRGFQHEEVYMEVSQRDERGSPIEPFHSPSGTSVVDYIVEIEMQTVQIEPHSSAHEPQDKIHWLLGWVWL